MDAKAKIGRLALRQEGLMWNAYYAMPMEGAIFLGSVRTMFVADHPARKKAFMDIMREAVADIIEQKAGVRPLWGSPQTAPDHERSGNA